MGYKNLPLKFVQGEMTQIESKGEQPFLHITHNLDMKKILTNIIQIISVTVQMDNHSMDFRMDRCLQSIAHQSHSVNADWIVKYRRAMPTCL